MARFPVLNRSDPETIFTWAGQLIRRLEGIFRASNSGSFTLATSAGSTTVTDPAARSGGKVVFTSETSAAATEVTSTYIADGDVNDGSFVVTHASNATAGRTYSYVIFEPLRGVR